MYLTDPIADMLTRVRNANAVMHEKVDIPHSKMKERIAEILKEQGYISNFKIVTDEGNKKSIRVYLKYAVKEFLNLEEEFILLWKICQEFYLVLELQ